MPRIRQGIRLIVPGNVRHNSGGNAYNAALAREFTALGMDVRICRVDGHWPAGSREERRRLAALLLEGTGGGARHDQVTIVDSLVGCGAPDELEAAAAAGRPAWILLHMPLTEHLDHERRALLAAAGVICASSSAAEVICARHGVDGGLADGIQMDAIHVALPGTDTAPLAAGSDPPHLTAVAALFPNKDQLLLLQALALLKDLPWTAALVGSDSADPVYAERVRDAVVSLGLMERVDVPGELSGESLDAAWQRADLSLLISKAEDYGMVVSESLAHGIPVVVRDGTGAVEALGTGTRTGIRTGTGVEAQAKANHPEREGSLPALPGTAVVLDTDAAPLAAVLRRWLTEPDLRGRWRAAALHARNRLPGWDATARTVLGALQISTPGNTVAGVGLLGNRYPPVDSPPEQADGQ
jgi:glycosyltransferase involved in cell wall biosynthesis